MTFMPYPTFVFCGSASVPVVYLQFNGLRWNSCVSADDAMTKPSPLIPTQATVRWPVR